MKLVFLALLIALPATAATVFDRAEAGFRTAQPLSFLGLPGGADAGFDVEAFCVTEKLPERRDDTRVGLVVTPDPLLGATRQIFTACAGGAIEAAGLHEANNGELMTDPMENPVITLRRFVSQGKPYLIGRVETGNGLTYFWAKNPF